MSASVCTLIYLRGPEDQKVARDAWKTSFCAGLAVTGRWPLVQLGPGVTPRDLQRDFGVFIEVCCHSSETVAASETVSGEPFSLQQMNQRPILRPL